MHFPIRCFTSESHLGLNAVDTGSSPVDVDLLLVDCHLLSWQVVIRVANVWITGFARRIVGLEEDAHLRSMAFHARLRTSGLFFT